MPFARCQADINSVVHKTGAKYSVLLQLPYYDAVRFVIIDPMHNLFLGLAKTTLKVWKKKELISDKYFDLLQKRVDAIVPHQKLEGFLQKFRVDSVDLRQTSGRTGLFTIQHLH